MAAPWESAGWGLSGPWRGRRAPAPTGSHVLPGSPQVLRRVGAGWPAGAGGLAMDHVVPAAARSPGWGQGADRLALMAIRAFPGLLGLQRRLLAQGAGWALLSCRLCGALARGGSVEGRGWRPGEEVGFVVDGGLAAAVSSQVDSRGAAGARAGPPPPVWFEFLERWRVTACPSPPPPLSLLLAGGPGSQPLLLPVQLRERPGPLPGPEAGQAAAAVGVTGPAAEGLAHAPRARTCRPLGTVPTACPLLPTWHLRGSLSPFSSPAPAPRVPDTHTPPASPCLFPSPRTLLSGLCAGHAAPCPLPPIVFGRICEGGCTPT
ncbi:uncharacterized protein [Globicephala melas]|uniref:uncharacterized protein n=1 Tax=Globicephala melas TaxID=9731 RepID=UPI00293D326F|nr:uncharacterized protein LOC132593769 [Globicephala melas]XP_060143431.1 uncharacterized protein LOC132593769 [Globicephala melas]